MVESACRYLSEEEYEQFFQPMPERANSEPVTPLGMQMDVDDYNQFLAEVRARQHLLSEGGVSAKAQVVRGEIAVALTACDDNLQICHVRRLRDIQVVGAALTVEARASLKRFLDTVRSEFAQMGIPLKLS